MRPTRLAAPLPGLLLLLISGCTDAPAGTWSYETDSVQATGATIVEAIAYTWRDG